MSGGSIVGLIGHPVNQSIGQIVYNRIFEDHGIDAVYLSLDIHPAVLSKFVGKSQFMDAFNVTIPHKTEIIQYIDDLDEIALKTGSVNLVKREGARLVGYNTDYSGLRYAISGRKINLSGKRVLIAGSGGVARTVIRFMEDSGTSEIMVLARNAGKSRRSLEGFGVRIVESTGDPFDVYVNCTPLGTHGNGDPFSSLSIPRGATGIDMVYNPMHTPFLRRIEEARGVPVSGFDVFVGQGIETLRILFDIAPEDRFRKYSMEALNEVREGTC